jgi:hypothetical protein
VRISVARLSGAPYGSVVMHLASDSAAGGPAARFRRVSLASSTRLPLIAMNPRPR